MVWNLLRIDRPDVALRHFAVPALIGLLGVFVPLGGEKAFASEVFKSNPEPADPGKHIDEFERKRARNRSLNFHDLPGKKRDLSVNFRLAKPAQRCNHEFLPAHSGPFQTGLNPRMDLTRNVPHENVIAAFSVPVSGWLCYHLPRLL